MLRGPGWWAMLHGAEVAAERVVTGVQHPRGAAPQRPRLRACAQRTRAHPHQELCTAIRSCSRGFEEVEEVTRSLSCNLTPQAETPRATTMLALGFSRRAMLRARLRARRLPHYSLRSGNRALLLHSEHRALLVQHRLRARAFCNHHLRRSLPQPQHQHRCHRLQCGLRWAKPVRTCQKARLDPRPRSADRLGGSRSPATFARAMSLLLLARPKGFRQDFQRVIQSQPPATRARRQPQSLRSDRSWVRPSLQPLARSATRASPSALVSGSRLARTHAALQGASNVV